MKITWLNWNFANVLIMPVHLPYPNLWEFFYFFGLRHDVNWILNLIFFWPNSMKKWIFKAYQPALFSKQITSFENENEIWKRGGIFLRGWLQIQPNVCPRTSVSTTHRPKKSLILASGMSAFFVCHALFLRKWRRFPRKRQQIAENDSKWRKCLQTWRKRQEMTEISAFSRHN